MKLTLVWIFVAIWFLHLFAGAGSAFAAWRLWPERKNSFIKRIIIYLHALMLDALKAVVLLFLAKGVHFTWKFSIVFFAFALLEDVMRLPLLLYVFRGPKATEDDVKRDPMSGDLPPDFWQKEFRAAVRDVIKPEFLR